MDRNDQYGIYDHDMSRSGSQRYQETDLYRQSYGENQGGRDWGSIATAMVVLGLGGYLLYQGVRGRSMNLPFVGQGGEQSGRTLDRAQEAVGGMAQGRRDTPGIQVREQITVNRSVPDLYRFWRNVENLPRVMGYLENVTSAGDRRSHWVAKGPAGQRVEWDAEITDARENELVAWRSLEGSEVPNEGSVRFSRSPDGSGTVIDVALTYHPPAGKAGAAVAKLLGREPAQEIRRDLERFKERVESGNLILATGSKGGY